MKVSASPTLKPFLASLDAAQPHIQANNGVQQLWRANPLLEIQFPTLSLMISTPFPSLHIPFPAFC
jgi:hypothetical protein